MIGAFFVTVLLCCCLYFVCKYKKVQKKLKNEIKEIGTADGVEMEDVKKYRAFKQNDEEM